MKMRPPSTVWADSHPLTISGEPARSDLSDTASVSHLANPTWPEWDEWSARTEICEVGRRLYHHFFVAANDGNISVRLNEDEIIMTPTNVSKGFMNPEDMIKLGMDGRLIASRTGRSASSERRMHLAIYKHRPDIRAVVHAHPPTATGLAVAGIGLDRPFLPETVVRTGPCPLVPYAIPGGDELPESIIPYLRDHITLLLGNHGAVAYAPTLTDAVFNMESIELNARIYLVASQVGPINYLNEEQIAALHARYA